MQQAALQSLARPRGLEPVQCLLAIASMLILFCRVLFSIAGLLLFFLFDQLSANECLKLSV
ncbi:MAG: hypothetical protein RSH52_02635, partial [Janthinobacterium sp.]